jgi:4-methylaminobutanoate oxidase (formaldehyde-forming)
VPVGYQALDSLRIEKGYRYFGSDMTASDTPFDSGVGFCVAKGKFPQLERNPAARLRTLVVGGEDYLTVYGGEAVHAGGEVIGRVRSAAYGFTLRRNIALAKLPAGLPEGAEVQVDVMGDLVAAVVSPDALYDPQNALVKS